MEADGALVAQRHPRRDVGATFFLQAVASGIPQGQAYALVPMRGSRVDGPDFTGGGAGLFVARAVVADKTDDLLAVDSHLDLGLAIFNGFAPVSLALFNRQGFQLLVGYQPFVDLLG
ncbi:hypothetical protein D3C71_1809950 [compost metagenome]